MTLKHTDSQTDHEIRRLVIIADVGGAEARHIGDEAILEANLGALRRLIPEVALTVVSNEPQWTADRYGVEAVPLFGFPKDPASRIERAALLDRLLVDGVNCLPEKTAAEPISNPTVAAVAHADGVIVSGGGNLSSTWPDLLYERIALLCLARTFGKPAVVLGQTIGPALREDEHELLSEALRTARFVGVRELPSALLALELQVPSGIIWYQADDALFLEPDAEAVSLPGASHAGRIAVTIDPQVRAAGDAVFDSLVSQLRELSQATSRL